MFYQDYLQIIVMDSVNFAMDLIYNSPLGFDANPLLWPPPNDCKWEEKYAYYPIINTACTGLGLKRYTGIPLTQRLRYISRYAEEDTIQL